MAGARRSDKQQFLVRVYEHLQLEPLRERGVAVEELGEEDRHMLLLLARGLNQTEVAAAMSLSRFTVRRRLRRIGASYSGSPRKCAACPKPLPRSATVRRKFCSSACSMRAARRRWAQRQWESQART